MKDLSKFFNRLKILYYEYDKSQNKFIKDKEYDGDTVYNDFIKLTYELSKNGIQFFVDENSDIVISDKTDFISKIKQKIQNFKYRMKNSEKNIYVLSDKHVEFAKNIPMIKTQTLKCEIDFDKYDAIIFTSKNGVKHLNSMTKRWKNIPTYAISTQTAKEIKKLGGKLAFVGEKKHGDEFALDLVEELKGKKRVAYIGAKNVVSNINTVLNEHNILCDHIAVYETVCIRYDQKIELPEDSIIIFSSPSTVKCFFQNVKWRDTFKTVCIGETTKKYFPEDVVPLVSDNTTLQSCVQKALSI